MAKPQILLLGAGGHCKSVIEAIESQGVYEIAGILEKPERVGQEILGYPIIGTDDEVKEWITKVPHALVTVGQLESAAIRMKLYQLLKEAGAVLPVIIASTAYVSKHAMIGEGTVVLHQAFVNAEAIIGVNNIVNTAAIIEHGSQIKDHVHISTGARVNGDCLVGAEVLIGSHAVLLQGIKIEDKVVVGAGAVVLRDVKQGSVVVGNPAIEMYDGR